MLEYIIRREWYLQKHLDAPLLKEREEYLTLMYKKGLSHSYLLSIAGFFLMLFSKNKWSEHTGFLLS